MSQCSCRFEVGFEILQWGFTMVLHAVFIDLLAKLNPRGTPVSDEVGRVINFYWGGATIGGAALGMCISDWGG